MMPGLVEKSSGLKKYLAKLCEDEDRLVAENKLVRALGEKLSDLQ